MEALLDPVEDSFKKAYMEEWVFISDAPSDRPSSTDQGEVIPETPRVSKLASSSPWKPVNELRHHCLRCGQDKNVIPFILVSLVPFLSVWSCRFQMNLSCLVTRNLTPQEMTFSLLGPN